MPEFRYARGRIVESIRFISEEIREFEEEYSKKSWKEYQEDKKLQKLMDRPVGFGGPGGSEVGATAESEDR